MIKKISDKVLNANLLGDSLDFLELRMRNDRQSIFQIARQLVKAQFQLGDQELTQRLWQDVADRNLDIDRIMNLMYAVHSHSNEAEMYEADSLYLREKG